MSGDLPIFNNALTDALARWDLAITEDQLGLLAAHYQAMVETNKTTNLTRITEPTAAAVKHYADSLALLRWIADADVNVQTILDVGTGAGFPAFPLAVMRPDWSITAIDATRKKIDFLRNTAAELNATNLHAVHAHSKHWNLQTPEKNPPQNIAPDAGTGFQLVLFRALRSLPTALEQTAQFLADDGYLVAYQTASSEGTEVDDATVTTARRLHLCPAPNFTYALNTDTGQARRALMIFRKDIRTETEN